MDLALNHFKADTTTNSNPISNAWNFLFMTVSGVELYHLESILQFETLNFYFYEQLIFQIGFFKLDCCGVNAVVSTTNDFDATTWCTTSGSCQATSSQIPKTCCLNVDENTYSSAPTACHASVNSGTYNTKVCTTGINIVILKKEIDKQNISLSGK